MELRQGDALIVVDVQRDFCPGGALAIEGGDDIVPLVNRLIEQAVTAGATVVASRDWHPRDHVSFVSRGGPWPEHCVQDSEGAKFHAELRLPPDAILISKGMDRERDQYSDFQATGLTEALRERGVRQILLCGLALDVCVRASGLDAARAGFETHVLREATKPLSRKAGEDAINALTRAGVIVD